MKMLSVKVRRTVLAWMMLGVAMVGPRAHAATLQQLDDGLLFETTSLVTRTTISTIELDIAAPGTLTFSLTDLNWPGLLDSLSFCLTDATHSLGKLVLGDQTQASWVYEVTAPGTLYATLFAKPDALAKAGMYHATVTYQSAVPLPAAIWFLLSGMAGLAAFRPKQKLSQNCA